MPHYSRERNLACVSCLCACVQETAPRQQRCYDCEQKNVLPYYSGQFQRRWNPLASLCSHLFSSLHTFLHFSLCLSSPFLLIRLYSLHPSLPPFFHSSLHQSVLPSFIHHFLPPSVYFSITHHSLPILSATTFSVYCLKDRAHRRHACMKHDAICSWDGVISKWGEKQHVSQLLWQHVTLQPN